MRRFALVVGLVLESFLIHPPSAQALPVFAHRYGFTCQQCHTTIPQLNTFGEAFQKAGYRLAGGARGVIPIAAKVNIQYQSQGDVGLPKAIVDEVELLSGGSLGRNTSYFVEQYAVDGGGPGRTRDAWVLFDKPLHPDDPAGTIFHARIGQFSLPLPAEPETERPTLSHYALYDQVVGGNAFNFFDPHVGGDLFVTDDRHDIESHLVLTQAYDRASGISSAGIDTMASIAKTLDDTWTATLYHYQGRRNLLPVRDRFYRDGYALRYQRDAWDVVASLQHGVDSSSDGLGMRTASSGGYLSANYAFNDAFQLVARYDDVFDQINGRAQSTTLSIITRPHRNMRFTLEAVRSGNTTQFGSGLLFAY